jgi:hypothetical protein
MVTRYELHYSMFGPSPNDSRLARRWGRRARSRLAKCLPGSLSLVVGTRSVLYKHFMGLWRYDSYAIAAVLVLVMVRPVL